MCEQPCSLILQGYSLFSSLSDWFVMRTGQRLSSLGLHDGGGRHGGFQTGELLEHQALNWAPESHICSIHTSLTLDRHFVQLAIPRQLESKNQMHNQPNCSAVCFPVSASSALVSSVFVCVARCLDLLAAVVDPISAVRSPQASPFLHGSLSLISGVVVNNWQRRQRQECCPRHEQQQQHNHPRNRTTPTKQPRRGLPLRLTRYEHLGYHTVHHPAICRLVQTCAAPTPQPTHADTVDSNHACCCAAGTTAPPRWCL